METPAAAAAANDRTLLTPEFMARLDALGMVSRKILAGKLRGERRSRKKGESLEFADYRNYAQGDDLRRIDWSLYARFERLFLKLFLAEEDLSIYVLLDGSASMNFGSVNKFDYARKVAAAVAYIGLANMDRVSVAVYADGQEHQLNDLRGKKQAMKLFDTLSRIQPGGPTRLQEHCRRFVLRHRRPGICLLLSDFLDPDGFEGSLKTLVAARMDVFAVHLLAPEEVEPVLTGDFLLVDSESGDRVDITSSRRLLENYQKTVRGFCSTLQRWCAARNIAYLFASTDLPFEVLVLNYLKGVGLVK